MTEKGKKPGTEAASQPDPLSATGMFLNAFAPQPEPAAEQAQESPAKGAAKPAQPGEFTQMFQKLEPPPSPPLPQTRSSNSPAQEPGEFTRTFVAAATSPGLRPAPATPDPAPFAPPPAPKMRGFSTPGVSDSASPEGSFTQLFRTPPSPPPAPSPLQPFTPLPSAPPQAAEPAWPQSLDPAPNGDRMAPGGLTQLFRSLSEESEPAPSRIGESPLVSHPASPAPPPAGSPASVTMLIQRLTEDLQQAAAPAPPMPPAAAPAGFVRARGVYPHHRGRHDQPGVRCSSTGSGSRKFRHPCPPNACVSRSAGSGLCRAAGSRCAGSGLRSTANSRCARSSLCPTTDSCARGPAATATQGCPEHASATEQTPADASHAAGLECIFSGGADPAVGLRS